MTQSPKYVIVVREATSYAPSLDLTPGSVINVYTKATNIGYSEIVGNIPQMFFTLSQDDPDARSTPLYGSNSSPAPYHFTVYRNGENVWSGWGPMELDETQTDIIVYSYGYAAGLYWTLTGWKEEYTSKTIKQIVDTAFAAGQAKTDSMLAWLTSGTVEAPVTTSGGATAITLPFYQANYKRLLFLLREMTAYAASDTTNRCWFEVTPDGTFNLWKNKGATKATPIFVYPKGNVLAYGRYRMPVDLRNRLQGVGTSPTDVDMQYQADDTGSQNSYGLREDSIYLQWVRDSDELQRVTKHRLALAGRVDTQLTLTLAPNTVAPIRATGGLEMMADYSVQILKGGTYVNTRKMVVGNQVLFVGGREYVRPILQDVPA